jgi:molybdopterin synthase catalytic subunit
MDLAVHKLDGYDEFMDLIKSKVPIGWKTEAAKGYYEKKRS